MSTIERSELDEMLAEFDDLFAGRNEFVDAADIDADASPEALAAEANRLAAASRASFSAARDNIRAGFRDAVRCGAHLLEIKSRVGHGKWLPWLEANFGYSVSTATAYMVLAREPVWLSEYLFSQSSASIDGALRFIRAQRNPEKPVRPEKPTPPDPNPKLTFTSDSLLDIAAKAALLMEHGGPQEWWAAIHFNQWRFRSAPDRDFWRRFGQLLIQMADTAEDPPEEPDFGDLVTKSEFATVTWADMR